MSAEASDLRTQLEQAYRASVEAEPDAAPKAETAATVALPAEPSAEADQNRTNKAGRVIDQRGRFVSGAQKPEADATATAPDTTAAPAAVVQGQATEQAAKPQEQKPAAALAPPNGWSTEAKAKWHELPAEIQAAVNQREQDVAKFTSKTDDERQFGREMHRVVSPYLAQIQAEGGTPSGAVQSLLNTAYILRTGTPQQKQQALLSVAQTFGIELPSPAQKGQQLPPEIQQLYQRLDNLEGTLSQQEQGSLQAQQASIAGEIEAFAADTQAHPHYHEVKAHMAALLRGGVAKDLQDAYDQACHARPDIRATLTAQQRVAEEQKRVSAEKAKADEARRKAVSITGGPGVVAATAAPGNRSLRDELTANFRASEGAI